jgi:hypothetical protein
MATSNLIRWGGLAALAGGVLWVVTDVAFFILIGDQPESIVGPTSTWVILAGLFLAGGILILLGLVGLYTFQAAEAGIVGLIAFLVAFIGTGLVVGALWAATFVVPRLAEAAPELVDAEPSGMLAIGFMLTFSLEALGWVLFGLASLRAAVLPRGPAVLLMVGAILSFVLGFFEIPFGDIVLEVALAWMGYAVWTRAGETATDA